METDPKQILPISNRLHGIHGHRLKGKSQVEIDNVGSEDRIDFKTIDEIVAEEMGLHSVEFKFTGSIEGGGGWKGDVKDMILYVGKVKSLGWKTKHNTEPAIGKIVREYAFRLYFLKCPISCYPK
ncbi:hypothetical protein KEJ21_05340 [Candidatus Bathyarchaeota archaeon]|nr:hypothetical protein [Candidatus Bathyarchaeota archaeon]MBS7631315.1 hypothetical protein [Candidatus Bathyarchaeota archaeon]